MFCTFADMDFEGVLSTKTLHLIPFQEKIEEKATNLFRNENHKIR